MSLVQRILIVLGIAAAGFVGAYALAHAARWVSAQFTADLCESTETVERALRICAETGQCVYTFSDVERLVALDAACSKSTN